MKNIIFLSDGTGKKGKDRTNIRLTYENLLKDDASEQVVKYDQGVGTQIGNIVRGTMWGNDINSNIIDGFEFISKHYEVGDRIYLFGFSRGAYTVRSLASMISLCGLAPKDATRNSCEAFFDIYKQNDKNDFKQRVDSLSSIYNSRPTMIEAVCVWDTVGAIGKQTRTTDMRKKMRHKYHRMGIYPQIKRIYHAVSLDERRTQYLPHLMIGQADKAPDTQVKEVWFAGVHSDIGGGYAEKELSYISLDWMLSNVNELRFETNFIDSLPLDPCSKMHNSEKGLMFQFFQKRNRPVARGTHLHRSVVARIMGPLKEPHQHREPSGNYTPLSLNFANYAMPPNFRLENYTIVD